jgi:hypothetical protein
MLVSHKSTPPQVTSQERAAEATGRLRKILGLSELSAADLKRLTTAIAEIAIEEAEVHPNFGKRILALYEELAPRKKRDNTPEPAYTGEDLVPISPVVGYKINVYGPPEPEVLLKIYGKDQLPKALSLFKPTKLKEAAAQIMQEHPGTKPKTKTKAEDLIAYIVAQVADNG